MKRLLGLGVTLVAAALLFAGGLAGTDTARADPLAPKFQYYIAYSATAPATNPDVLVNINIDCPLGVCPAASNVGFFDIAVTHFSPVIHSCGGTADLTAGCGGAPKPLVNAELGTGAFVLNTSIVAGNLPDNVSAVTGVPAACGGPGTTTLTSTFPIFNGALSAADLVSGKDGADANSLPDTQSDVLPANGAPDGADKLPDYIQLLFDTSLGLINNRGFGIAIIVPGQSQTDVNFLTIDLTAFGAGYASVTTLGDVRPASVADLNAGQSTVTCTPFTTTVTNRGVSIDRPANDGTAGAAAACAAMPATWDARCGTAAVEPPQPLRTIKCPALPVNPTCTPGADDIAGAALHYAIDVSATEDVDGDGVPTTQDRCDNPDVGLFPVSGLTAASGAADADGDGLGTTCDPDPATADNCPGVASVVKSAACTGAGANPASYPTKQSGCTYGAPGNNIDTATCTTPWNPDQDIDGDTHANWSDNCPVLANPAQIDLNGDAIGDVCQTTVRTAAGQLPPRPQSDFDDFCDASTTIGGPLAATTTCFAATAHDVVGGILTGVVAAGKGVAQDSNDDGFPDYLEVPGFKLTDKNSDSDNDGCSDFAETSGGAVASGGCGPSKGVASPAFPATACGAGVAICLNAKKANTNGLNDCIAWLPGGVDLARCLDGGKDDPNGTVDWKDIAGDPAQTDNTTNPLAGADDSDGDGCTNRREALPALPLANGGGRDALNKYDFYDVDLPVAGVLKRNKVVNISDTIGILSYIGVSAGAPNTPNANGKTYNGDDNLDGIKNFEIWDRSPGVPGLTGPPSGAVNISDAIANLSQIGANCSTP